MSSSSLEFIAFDLETTGLSFDADRIVEVGAVRFDVEGTEIARFECLLNPERPMPAGAFAVHGISDAMLADAALAAEVLPKFLEFLGDAQSTVLLAHNATFDAGFLGRELANLGIELPDHRVVDTLPLARQSLKKAPDHRLSTIAGILGLDAAGAHRALADCIRVKQMWLALEGPALPELWVSFPIFDPRRPKPAPGGYEQIDQAIARGGDVTIEYMGGSRGSGPRQISPKRYIHRGGSVYLVALCHFDAKEKEFRLDRIARHEPSQAGPSLSVG